MNSDKITICTLMVDLELYANIVTLDCYSDALLNCSLGFGTIY